MKKLLLILICLFVSFEVKSRGIDFDKLIERNGILYQKFTDTPFSGKVFGKEKGKLKKGLREGKWLTFRDNGQLRLKQYYENGKLENESLLYYTSGELLKKSNYKNGMKEGKEIEYLPDGTVYYERNFKNGKLNGEVIKYFEGSYESQIYKNDIKDGMNKRVRKDGSLISSGMFKNNKREGEFKVFDEKGNYLGNVVFKNDEKIGQEIVVSGQLFYVDYKDNNNNKILIYDENKNVTETLILDKKENIMNGIKNSLKKIK